MDGWIFYFVFLPFAMTACTKRGLAAKLLFQWSPLPLWLQTNTHHSTAVTSQPHWKAIIPLSHSSYYRGWQTPSLTAHCNHTGITLVHDGWQFRSAHPEHPAPQHPPAHVIHHYIQPGPKPGALTQPPRQPAVHSCTDPFTVTTACQQPARGGATLSSRFQQGCQTFYHPERWRLSKERQTLGGSQRQPMQQTQGQSWSTLKTSRQKSSSM